MWPTRLCSATWPTTSPEHILIYIYVCMCVCGTQAGQKFWSAWCAVRQSLAGSLGRLCGEGEGEGGVCFDSSAQLKTSIWVCHKLHRVWHSIVSKQFEGERKGRRKGGRTEADWSKTVKEIKYFVTQLDYLTSWIAKTNNIYLHCANTIYDTQLYDIPDTI